MPADTSVPVPSVRVACCQIAPRIGAPAANRAACRLAAERAAGEGARIIVLPELANSGYVFRDEAEARTLAEPLDGPTVAGWLSLAGTLGVTIVGGICELGHDGLLYNTAVVIAGSRLRAVYRKAHLWDAEKLVFTPGRAPPPVTEAEGVRLAVMICYDIEFPEWVRLPALAGAQLLCAPANWPLFPRPATERPIEVVRAQAAASVNRMFVAVCDRVGHERGVDWVGGSVIIDPDGWPLAGPGSAGPACAVAGGPADAVAGGPADAVAGGPADAVAGGPAGAGPVGGECILVADCAAVVADDKSVSEHNDVLADRRPQLYGGLVE